MSRRDAGWLVAVALIGVGIGGAARVWGASLLKVTTGSMSPTIGVGQWVVETDLDAQGRRGVERGDIVVFRFPLGTAGRAIKRVVAVAGDEVEFTARSFTVNGRSRPIAGSPSTGAGARKPAATVPAGHVFLLGDNSRASVDSRQLGPVAHRELFGRVRFVVPGLGSLLAGCAAAVLLGAVVAVGRRRSRG